MLNSDYTDFPEFLKVSESGYTLRMEKIPERQERPPRNLLTNYEETLAAMTELETPEWLLQQESLQHEEPTIANALRWLSRHKGVSRSFTVLGWGGINRWIVRLDGTVSFLYSEAYKAGSSESAERAAALGFEVVDRVPRRED